jgi:phosphohistidine phosphatase
MKVILFRHGPAGTRDPVKWSDDDQRPLSAAGKLKTHSAATGLARLEDDISLILTSPLLRCLQTAELLADLILPSNGFDIEPSLAPAGSREALVQRLNSVQDTATVVLVGHEPDLGRLAGWLMFGTGDAIPLRKAGACALEFDGRVQPGVASLGWFLSPSYLRELSKKKYKKKKAHR